MSPFQTAITILKLLHGKESMKDKALLKILDKAYKPYAYIIRVKRLW